MADALDQKGLEAAVNAFNKANLNPVMVECRRCNGRGYHHGFGERGEDPDWCSDCGGGGYELAKGEEDRPIADAIRAYLSTVIPVVQAETRRQALEEAAKVADDPWASAPHEWATAEEICEGIAAEIRALIDQPITEGGKDG